MSASNPDVKNTAVAGSAALCPEERFFFRDRLREARYAALADAEGFQQMCFAIEALGKRINPTAKSLGECRDKLQQLANTSALIPGAADEQRAIKTFHALFTSIKEARNDAMHTGAYARHVAADAVTLCMVLEDALMVEKNLENESKRLTAGDFMVSSPVIVHPWQTVEHARQLMLLNSFSYLPIWFENKWWLIADIAVAKYLRPSWPAKRRLKMTLEQAYQDELIFEFTEPVNRNDGVAELLDRQQQPGLWLVRDDNYPPGHLIGVLSPFELM